MILVTGGAGYIGSHVVKQLLEQSKDIIVLDNLSTSSRSTLETLKNIKEFTFVKEDLKNFDNIEKIFKKYKISSIMHFAASIVVPESVVDPLKYYMNNTVNTTNLLKLASKYNIEKFIFSSTAAVYGEPENISTSGISEESITTPINPYGMSKLMSEKVIQDVAKANKNFKYVIFRYFNVAGADINYLNNNLSPRIGQSFPNATHLIKIASECANKKREKMFIFGTDYDTSDGTCIRDYIHVDDLAQAHIQSLEYLDKNNSDIFNIGYGKGTSVKEVCDIMKEVTESDFNIEVAERRSGDPSILISNNSKIKLKMNWEPRFNDLKLICKSAYEWEKNLK